MFSFQEFISLAVKITEFISSFSSPVVLMGESFGGLLSTYVSVRAKKFVSKLVLVNPATSYDQTSWSNLGSLISKSGPVFPTLGALTLALTVVEPYQIQFIGNQIIQRINTTEDAIREIGEMLNAPNVLATLLPPSTLQWRLSQWLQVGCNIMEDKYNEITTPTLILIGTKDRLLPSANEGYRLKEAIKKTFVEVIEFPNGGHAVLDGAQNLSKVLFSSSIFGEAKSDPPILNIYPTSKEIADADRQYGPIFKAASSVFLSRTSEGRLIRGINSIPVGLSGRPVLLVGNHQLYGADLPLIIREFLRSKNTLVRGLAHPIVFSDESRQTNSNSGMNIFKTFGAVKVSPSSFSQLLQMNATILLFPGGAKEAAHKKGEEYKLFWPEKIDFVRLAAVYGAIIVPFAAIGVADSFNLLLDSEEMLNMPFLGERVKSFNRQSLSARPGVEESLLGPISVPKIPSRNYFLFQNPIDTAGLNIYDKKSSKILYESIRGDVEEGIELLLKFREKDPYKDFTKRILYETLTGNQAPTATLNLNLKINR